MIWGTLLTLIGVAIMGLTFLPDLLYTIAVFTGFILFGLGLGMYATPSTDTAVSAAPDHKIGEASGIYKMASSLGNAFGIAISMTIYSTVTAFSTVNVAATAGIITNVTFAVLSLISIISLVPGKVGPTKRPRPTTRPAPSR